MREEGKRGTGERVLAGLLSAVGHIPLRILYLISDCLSFLAGSVVRYRHKVVRRNLRNSFPEKSDREIGRIERKFYRFLGDYVVETLRLGVMSRKEIERRMRFEGQEEVNRYLEAGRNVTLYLGHYGNWEWLSSIPLHTPAGIPTGQIYHALENRTFNQLFLGIRSHFGATSIEMNDTLQTMMRWRREGKPSIIGYIADQTPRFDTVHYFADFLNQETAAFTGPERLSRMFDAVVFYCDITRPRRGEYVCRYVKMTDNVGDVPKFELTRRYFELLEGTIRRRPELWLWSHNRWKRHRDQLVYLYGEEGAARRLSHL